MPVKEKSKSKSKSDSKPEKVKEKNQDKLIPVMEMFGPTIQGEGALCGQVSYFLRTGGCPYRCVWCDQIEAVDPKLIKKNAEYTTSDKIISQLEKMLKDVPAGTWVTLSGGDPLMWDLERVVAWLASQNLRVACETQGSLAPIWLQYVDLITCSPKPPSSGMHTKLNPKIIQKYHEFYGPNKVALKVVIFNNEDLDFAQRIHDAWPDTPFYLSVGTPTYKDLSNDQDMKQAILIKYKWLAEEVLKRQSLWSATISPQMHALIWAREKGK